ncbi:MAG: endonuclease, partial [Candidatus Omnitrophica bacterium CG02_land_8_20_14_3_00__42_8]
CNDWDVIYAEDYKDRLLAMKRERFFKTGDGRKVLKFKGILR